METGVIVGCIFTLLCSQQSNGVADGSVLAQRMPHPSRPERVYERVGSLDGGEFGAKVAFIGDLDGDGVHEWMAGRTGPATGGVPPELRVYSGASGELLYVREGLGSINFLFLETLADLGDVDGDGVPDFAYGNANAVMGQSNNVGAVDVYSGVNGQKLYTRWGLMTFGGFGASLAALGDIDGDEAGDFVAGAIGTLDENVYLVSGATGSILFGVQGPTGMGDIEFGWSVAKLDDVDGDGRADFAVGSRKGGFVDAYSSADGSQLFHVTGGKSFGLRLRAIGDLNRDGVDDLIVGEPSANSVHLLSGVDGSGILTVSNPRGGNFGITLASTGDLDGDHLPDLLVGDTKFGQSRGRVQVLSSQSGAILYEVRGLQPMDRLGEGIAASPRFDESGHSVFLLGAPGIDRFETDRGGVVLYRARE